MKNGNWYDAFSGLSDANIKKTLTFKQPNQLKIWAFLCFLYTSIKASIAMFDKLKAEISGFLDSGQVLNQPLVNGMSGAAAPAGVFSAGSPAFIVLSKVNYLLPLEELIALTVSLLTLWALGMVLHWILVVYKVIPLKSS
jgi:hypothetical protein